MRLNRTKNTLLGSTWGLINQVIMVVFPFIIRTCIIYVMGEQYVGLSSLFSAILSVLSLAELGVGSAIVFSMYKPLADEDDAKICALLKLYRDVYTVIGIVVLGVGLLLLPFLPALINGSTPSDINISYLYIIYLINSVISYWFFAYKSCLLNALQRVDAVTMISLIIRVLGYIAQILVICLTKNYYYYAIFLPITSVAINLVIGKYVDINYPQYKCSGKIDNREKKQIRKQVVGLLFQRLAYTSRNALDNIIISALLGLSVVAIYGNYFLILNALTACLAVFFTAMQAGIGNSIVKENIEKNFDDLEKINFIYMWIAGWCSICLLILMQPFMKIWVGERLMFPLGIVCLFSFYFFCMKLTDSIGAYIAATGIWWECKWIYLFETLCNLVLNILLGFLFGVAGIIIATIISVLFINYFFTTRKLFKIYFKEIPLYKFLKKNVLYFFVTITIAAISFISIQLICNMIKGEISVYLEMFIKTIICVVVPNLLYYIFYKNLSICKRTFAWLQHILHLKRL